MPKQRVRLGGPFVVLYQRTVGVGLATRYYELSLDSRKQELRMEQKSATYALISLLLGCLGLAGPLAAAEVVAVEARPLAELVIYPERESTAAVLSLDDTRLEAEISARIAAIPVRVGETVQAGQLLLQLDCRDHEDSYQQAQAAVQALQARLSFARFQLQRARTLSQGNAISEEQLRQRQSELSALQAELGGSEAASQRAERDVQRCQLHAPFDAVIVERLAGVGERAVPGKPLLHLLSLEGREVSAQVAAADVASLESSEAVWLESNAQRYPLQLARVSAALDSLSGAHEVRLVFRDEEAAPGATGRLVWRSPGPWLPAALLQQRDGQFGIFTLSGGKAVFIPVPGAEEGRLAPVTMPLDTLVVTDGRFSLRDGDVVRLVE